MTRTRKFEEIINGMNYVSPFLSSKDQDVVSLCFCSEPICVDFKFKTHFTMNNNFTCLKLHAH